MKNLKGLCRLAATAVLGVSLDASAVIIYDTPPDTPPPDTPPPTSVLTPDAGWYGSCYLGVGAGATESSACALDAGEAGNSMSLDLASSALFKITAMLSGDVYDVYVNSVLVLTTNTPTLVAGLASDPDVAFASTDFSSESLTLGPGSYSIDVFAAALSPVGLGVSAIEVQTVPVPAAMWFFSSGLIGLIGLARRKNT